MQMTIREVRNLRKGPRGGVFGIPALIAAISLVGLVSALVGDELLDVISWTTLGIPVAVMLWAYARDWTKVR